jgi:hypothetical protein
MDRKAMARGYKERRPTMGVFQVRNIANGRVLIGASTDVPAMLNRQQAQLRLGAHPNRELQADWRALGPDAFAFEVLDTLSPSDAPDYDPRTDLKVLESMWLERLAPYGARGYHRDPEVGH